MSWGMGQIFTVQALIELFPSSLPIGMQPDSEIQASSLPFSPGCAFIVPESPHKSKEGSPMTKREDVNKNNSSGTDAVRGWIHIINTREYGKLKDFFDEEAYVTYAAGGFPEFYGYDAISKLIEGFHHSISELHCTIEDLLETADGRVVGRFLTKGIHTGEFMGVKPTGKAVSINGIAIYTLRNGRIIHEWNMDDLLGLLQQVGAWPMPGDADA